MNKIIPTRFNEDEMLKLTETINKYIKTTT